jgi:hypothetical protein
MKLYYLSHIHPSFPCSSPAPQSNVMDFNIVGTIAFHGISNQVPHASIVAFATNKGNEWCHSEPPLFCHCEHLKGAWQSHISQDELHHDTDEAACTMSS